MRLLVCLALVLAPTVCAEVELSELLRRSAASANPSLSFLSGLGEVKPGTVERDELWTLLDDLDAAEVRLPKTLRTILDATDSIEVGEGATKKVRFALQEDLEPLALGPGYAHLKRDLRFTLRTNDNGDVVLDEFQGFKLSKKPGSWIKVKMQEVRFETKGEAAVARVDAGAGGIHQVALGKGKGPTSPVLMATGQPKPETEGILGALDEPKPKPSDG